MRLMLSIEDKKMNDKNVLKKHISKIAIFTTIISAVILNEQILLGRLKKQKEKFEAEKEILNNKIAYLKEKNKALEKDTSFRFYKILRNGANYEEFEKISNDSFVWDKENVYEKYRADSLSLELLENYDSISFEKDKKHSNDLLDKELETFDKFKNSDSIDLILENGQVFLNSLVDIMKFHNRSVNNNLTRILENSDEVIDREFKARYFMFGVKAKNQIYPTKYDMTADYYRILFLKNVLMYRKTAKYINSIVDSLTNVYNAEKERDSIEFEIKKNKKIDSLLNFPSKKGVYPQFMDLDFAKYLER